MSDVAFLPPIEPAAEGADVPSRLFRNRRFLRLWLAQVVSSLGDWIGLVAILALAARVSQSGTAVALVMIARMLPGFLLAPLGGALVDRWNRRTVMIVADVGRAGLLLLLPFFDNLTGLVLISLGIEIFTLLWGPAKDASVPNVVPSEQLASANSLSLVAAYGTFPLAAVIFAALAGIAKWLGGFDVLDRFQVDQEALAIWVDSTTFLVSALFILRLTLPEGGRGAPRRVEWTRTLREVTEGLRFIRSDALVRGVMIGLAGGLLGGGAMIPLGPVFAPEVLGAGSAGFGVLMTALGLGAAVGVVTLLWLQRRLPLETVFILSLVACGSGIVVAASVGSLAPATTAVVFVGAAAGCGYVSGFTLLQEGVSDELRGRVFATLYTLVRLCLLVALALGGLVANVLDALSERFLDGSIELGGGEFPVPGVRLALWLGGAITIAAGLAAMRIIHRTHRPRALGPAA